jgi:hypothetical protein
LESPYLSIYDVAESKIKKDRKKYFFEEIISKSVSRMEELYKINKGHFKVEKQKQIEETLIELNELKNMDMSKRTLKEMIKRLNILSYNDHDIVEATWCKKDNVKGKIQKPKTFEEDLEFDEKEITNIFMKPNNSDSDSDSDISEEKNLIFKKIFIKK